MKDQKSTFIAVLFGVVGAGIMLYVLRLLVVGTAVTTMTETTTKTIEQMGDRFKQQAAEANRDALKRAQEAKRLADEKNAQVIAQRQQEAANKAQEKRLLTPECQFWWQQNDQAPTERTAQKKAEHCDG